MLNLLKRMKREDINLVSNLEVDLHSHILPNLDDGSESIQESMEMIKKLIDLGYKKAIMTPHIMGEYYKNDIDNISEAFNQLICEVCKEHLPIELEVSAEYYFDSNFIKLIKENHLIPLHYNYILFETSFVNFPINLEEIIFEMKLKGYTPILAHPERYEYIDKDYKLYNKLKEMGILFQVDLNSFNGKYGEEALKKAMWLSKRDLIDFLGSDAHSISDIDRMSKDLWLYPMERVLEENHIKNSELLT